MGEILSRNGLAGHFGVSLPTVDAWVRRGCPIEKRGARGAASEFDLEKVSHWVRRYTSHGKEITHKGRSVVLQSNDAAIIAKSIGYISTEAAGIVADAAISAGVPCRAAYAIDVGVTIRLTEIMSAYLKMNGISDAILDMYSSWSADINWEETCKQRNEEYSEGGFTDAYDALCKVLVRLPRNGDLG